MQWPTVLRDQELAGLRAGIDLGRYVGVRAFYWRGTNKDFKRAESLQSWGGGMQLRLNSSPGLHTQFDTGLPECCYIKKTTFESLARARVL